MASLLRQARDYTRRLSHDPEPPIPPELPPARIVMVPDRGEMFVRDQPGPDDAPPVLLLHGWTATSDTTWFSTYGVLAGRHRLIAPDHRGHGRGIRSEVPFSLEACADDAAALLDHLGIDRAIVAGYSMGGAVGMLMWKRHRQRVAGMVLAGTAVEWRSTPHERVLWASMTMFDVGLRIGTGEGFVLRYLRQATADNPELAPMRAWVAGEMRRGYHTDLAHAGRALSRFDGRPFAPSVDVPCASVITTADRLVLARKQEELARAVRAQVFRIDANHDAPFVKPKEFASVMDEAVAVVAGDSAAP